MKHVALFLVGVLVACAPLPELTEPFVGDIDPPVLLGVAARDARTITVSFDEAVSVTGSDPRLEPHREVSTVIVEGEKLVVSCRDEIEAGTLFYMDGSVADRAGNTTSFLVSVYGKNECIPDVIINEFVCEGSSTHPDIVELRVRSSGDMAGLALYEGSPSVHDSLLLFPALEVAEGDYILVHFKPQRIDDEQDEVSAKDESGGLDASDQAWDIWVPGGDGIANTTGALMLCEFPDGPAMDAVLYSTKTYDPDDDLRGYGLASQLTQAEEIVAAGAWRIAGDIVIPQDGINPTDSTATRSICRNSSGDDTDDRSDWHIVPTGTASLGSENSDLVY